MKKLTSVLPLFALGLLAPHVQADIKYTETMKMGLNSGDYALSTTTWAKEGARRTESKMSVAGMDTHTVTLERCDEGKTYRISPSLKLYTTDAPDAGMGALPVDMDFDDEGNPKPKQNKGGTGTSILEYTVKDLGTEKVAGVDTRHYSVSMKMTATGCAGQGTHTMNFESWTADIPMPKSCGNDKPGQPGPAGVGGQSACDVKTEIKGDQEALQKAFGGLMMRMKMDGKGQPITKEVTEFSQAPLADDIFRVPAGFKQVSAKEFQKAESDAMMKKLTGGMGMPGDMMGGMGGGMLGGLGGMMGGLGSMLGGPLGGMAGGALGGLMGGGGFSSVLKGALGGLPLPF